MKRVVLITLSLLFSIGSFALETYQLSDEVNSFSIEEGRFEVYLDKSNDLSLIEVRQLPSSEWTDEFIIHNENPEFAYWIRMKVEQSSSVAQKWVLEVLDSRHSSVEFYSIDGSEQYVTQVSGVKYPFSKRPYGHKNFVFDLDVTHAQKNFIYLKFKSSVVGSLFYKIHTNQAFSRYAFSEYYWLGIYYGILIIIALYNLMIYFSVKEKLYLFYVFFVVSWAFQSLMDDGLGYQFFWTDVPSISELGFALARPCMLVFFVLYASRFLEIRNFHSIWPKVLWGSVGVFSILHATSMLDSSGILYFATFFAPFVAIYILAWQVYKSGYQPVRFFLVGNGIIILGVVLRLAKDHLFATGFGDNVVFDIIGVYATDIAIVLDVVILSFALADRIRFLKIKEEDAQKEIIGQLKENESLSQKVNKELEEKVAERTEALEDKSLQLVEANEKLMEQAEEINKMNLMLDLDNRKLQKNVKAVNEARIRFKDVLFGEFQDIYPDRLSVTRYLNDVKWKGGYVCRKCGNEKFCDGSKKYSRRCTKCRYDESVTAYTLLHKCKFDLVKALYIVMKVNRHGEKVNINELARQLEMRTSTVWSFKQKVVEAKANTGGKGETGDDLLARIIAQPAVEKE